MKREIENPYPDRNCFFCGRGNPHGVHLVFLHDDESGETSAEYVPEERFVGQGNILHGGIQMGLLDEAMGWACVERVRGMAVTVRMEAEFLRPLRVDGSAVRVVSRVTGQEGRDVRLRAELVDAQGEVCTRATAVYRAVSPEKYAALTQG